MVSANAAKAPSTHAECGLFVGVRKTNRFNPDPVTQAYMAIKPDYVKKTGTQLLEQYPDAFSDDFSHNKRSVRALTNIESKGVRNRIAGFVTRRKRN